MLRTYDGANHRFDHTSSRVALVALTQHERLGCTPQRREVSVDACMNAHAAFRPQTTRECCISHGLSKSRVRGGRFGCTDATGQTERRLLCVRTPRAGTSSTSVLEDRISFGITVDVHLFIAPCGRIALREDSTQSGREQEVCTEAASQDISRHPGPCNTRYLRFVS